MRTVASIENCRPNTTGQQMRSTRRLVPHHHKRRPHRLDISGRVDEGLPFGEAASRCGEVDRIGTEAFGSQRKTGSCSSRRLKEQVGDNRPTQQVQFRVALERTLLEFSRLIENGGDFPRGQIFQAQQVLTGPT